MIIASPGFLFSSCGNMTLVWRWGLCGEKGKIIHMDSQRPAHSTMGTSSGLLQMSNIMFLSLLMSAL